MNLGKILSDAAASELEHIAAVTWFEIARRRGAEPGSAFADAQAQLTGTQANEALQNADHWLSAH